MRHRAHGASKVITTPKEHEDILGHRKSQRANRNFAYSLTMAMYPIIIFLRICFNSKDYTDLCIQIYFFFPLVRVGYSCCFYCYFQVIDMTICQICPRVMVFFKKWILYLQVHSTHFICSRKLFAICRMRWGL